MKKIIKRIGLAVVGLVVIALALFIIWAVNAHQAELEKLAVASDQAKNDYRITEKTDYWEIIPNNPDSSSARYKDAGLIFYPGAKVEPQAYFYKLSGLANGQTGKLKIFITKPTLNLAVFNINQADQVIADHPEVKKWIIGGHSLGGAVSCGYAANHPEKISELWLFGAYCGNDISASNIDVISIYGARDGILTPQSMAENRKNLPATAANFEIEGMNHAQIGNYGAQSGDNEATKSDEDARLEIMKIFGDLLSRQN